MSGISWKPGNRLTKIFTSSLSAAYDWYVWSDRNSENQNLTCTGKQLERDRPLPLLDKWRPLFLNMTLARCSDTEGAFKPLLEFGPFRTIVMSQREGLQKDAHTPSAVYLHSWKRFMRFLRQCQTCGYQNWLVWEAMDPALGSAGISYGLYPPVSLQTKSGEETCKTDVVRQIYSCAWQTVLLP